VLPGQKYTPEQLVKIVWRRRWFILLPAAFIAALAAVASLKIPNRFRSETVILVVPQRVPDSYVRSTVTSNIEDRLPSISQQILSRTRLERVITDFNLYAVERKTKLMEQVVAEMQHDITVLVVKGDAFKVSYVGEQPKVVADVTNRLASLFIEENLRDREQMAEGTNQFLQSELEAARQRLAEHEKKLELYRKSHAGELPSQLDANLQVIQNTQLQIQSVIDSINRNRDRRLVVDQTLNDLSQSDIVVPQARPRTDDTTAASLPDQLEAARAQLRQLQSHLTEEHPDVIRMKRLVADLEQKVATLSTASPDVPSVDPAVRQKQLRVKQLRVELDSIDRQIAASQAEEQRLRGIVADYQHRVEAAPARETEMTELMRDYATLQSVYSSLLQKREDSKMAANLERRQIGEQFKLLDPAKPAEAPYSPNRMRIVLAAAALGLLMGAAFVGLREYQDRALHTDEDVASAIGLQVLANIPLMLTGDEKRRQQWRTVWLNVACSALVAACGALVMLVITRGLR
jgi:polysaccharide chain length determinant protein (PEP-CTERM system associated)